jgi:XTP/dITP diphosphohydrolase
LANQDSNALGALVGVIADLRAHCPWMGALTHESLVEYLLEEAYEVAETIETARGDAELKAELGDVLLQVVLHARLAQERGAFDLDDVARGLTAKMVRRNPHVFRADGSLQETFPATVQEIVQKWDAVKRSEQVLHTGHPQPGTEASRADPSRLGALAGVPAALPALARAQKLQDRAQRAGLPAFEPGEPLAVPASEEDLGDLLFAVAAAARARGLDAERALRGANRRFLESQSPPSSP